MTITWLLLCLSAVTPSLQAASAADPSAGTLLQEHGKPVTALVFSWDGRMLASGSGDGTLSIWSVGSNHLIRTVPVPQGKIAALAFSPKGDLIATGGDDNSIRIWDASGAKQVRTLKAHTNSISALAFTPDGLTLASGGVDGTLLLWNTGDWTLKRRLAGHASCVHALRASSNNQFLASGSDECLRIWNLEDASYACDTFFERVRALSYYDLNIASQGDQKPKFACSDGKGLQLWQPSGVVGTHILTPWADHIGIVFSESKTDPTAVADDNGLLATGWANGEIQVWDADGYGSFKVVAHRGPARAIALSPKGLSLVTGGEDGTIQLWSVRAIMDAANSKAAQKRKADKRPPG